MKEARLASELAIGAIHFFVEFMLLDTSKVQATMPDADVQKSCATLVSAVVPALAPLHAENAALLGMQLAQGQAFREPDGRKSDADRPGFGPCA